MATMHSRPVGGRLVKMVPIEEQCKTLDNASGFWCTLPHGHSGDRHENRSATGWPMAEWTAPRLTIEQVRAQIVDFEKTLTGPLPDAVRATIVARLETLRRIERYWR